VARDSKRFEFSSSPVVGRFCPLFRVKFPLLAVLPKRLFRHLGAYLTGPSSL
jgi:hypothetical protein